MLPDFSDESIKAAHTWLEGQYQQRINELHTRISELRSMRFRATRIDGPGDLIKYQAVVIGFCQEFKDAPGFEARWDLAEDKARVV